jgi:hypothetical protein
MTTGDDSSVPLLDLAPKLDRPLSLRNPLDYLRVLYWVFFFPQALRWYVEVFGVEIPPTVGETPDPLASWYAFMRTPTPQRDLYLQGLLLAFAVPIVVSSLLQASSIPVDWSRVMFGAVLGVIFDVVLPLQFGVSRERMSRLIALEVAIGVAISMGIVVASGIAIGVPDGLKYSLMGAIVVGVPVSVAACQTVGIPIFLVGFSVYLVMMFVVGLLILGVFGVAASMSGSLDIDATAIYMALGVALSGACMFLMSIFRVPDFLVAAMLAAVRGPYLGSHTTLLPIPGLQRQVVGWLQTDLVDGLANLDQLQRYSSQFIPIVKAVNEWLDASPEEQLLLQVERLACNPYAPELIRYGSASLAREFRNVIDESPSPPLNQGQHGWPKRYDAELRLDTPARAACAGFWALHVVDIPTVIEAFAAVRHLPGGAALHRSAEALNAALADNNLPAIADWASKTGWMAVTLVTEDESIIIKVLRQLREVALEAAIARDSLSRLNRNAAFGRAGAMLTHLLEDLDETYPELVRPVTRRIATQWRDILSKAGGEIGRLTVARPVANPFVVGDPVVGRLFAGREAILRRLEELWSSDPSRPAPSVVLYGHRRMGKTSILRNLEALFGRDTVIVPFTMQRVGRVSNTGELLHALALQIYDALADAGLPAPTEPDEAAFTRHPYRAFNQSLTAARAAVGRRRIILTIDEFEAIEAAIQDGRVESDLLSYLRGVIQSEPWLVLAFAGLHTLQEMTGDYWNPLYGSVIPIRVGFFSTATSADLLANPTDDFPLDFSRAAAERVFDHVRGQPYLTQLIGHTLVSRYNREMFEEERAREPRFTAEEVDAVVASAEFYEVGDAYFSGVWGQANDPRAPGQHALLIALAQADGGVTVDELVASLGRGAGRRGSRGEEDTVAAALDALERHDVVARDAEGRVDFTVPLMRRWIRQNKTS